MSRQIVCFKCKRSGPESDNNHAYCVACEAEVRRAYEKWNDCPRCGSVGKSRGRFHWSGRTDLGQPCGGFENVWYCAQCRQTYSTRT